MSNEDLKGINASWTYEPTHKNATVGDETIQ